VLFFCPETVTRISAAGNGGACFVTDSINSISAAGNGGAGSFPLNPSPGYRQPVMEVPFFYRITSQSMAGKIFFFILHVFTNVHL
jgi:hypothetical protein